MDDADRAKEYIDSGLAIAVEAARGDILPGDPGECERCGEDSPRLVGGACVPCRERLKLS